MLKDLSDLTEELRKKGTSIYIEGPQHTLAIEALLTSSFPVLKGQSFYSDFPVWNPSFETDICRVVVVEHDEVVATAGIRFAKYKDTGKLIGMIGGVATRPKNRGQGLASLCVLRLLEIAERRSPHAIILWGSEYELYNRLGFEMFGVQIRSKVRALVAKTEIDPSINIGRGWVKGLEHALLKRKSGIDLTIKDMDWVSAHKNIDWWWVGSPTRIEAYAALGRGMDLHSIIHEWGGEKEKLHYLLNQMSSKMLDLQIIGNEELFRQHDLNLNGAEFEREFLCLSHQGSQKLENENIWLWGLDGC